MRLIASTLAALLLAACATTAPPPTSFNGLKPFTVVTEGAPFVIPEESRNSYHVVAPGSVLTVALDQHARIAAVMSGRAPPVPPIDHPGLATDKETLEDVRGNEKLNTLPDRLEFSLWSNARDGTVMMIKNGEHRPLIYLAAVIHGDPRPENFELTTICSVAPGKITFESWPGRVDGIAILKVMEPPPSDATICIDPTKNYDNPTWYKIDD